MTRELELYLHIPYCVRKCAYCDFVSAPPSADGEMGAYVRKLREEIAAAGRQMRQGLFPGGMRPLGDSYEVTSLFFGGGTPSILPAEAAGEILSEARKNFSIRPDAEVTLEANPDTVTPEKLRAWKNAGINRLSMGVQSADDRELRLLGRIHDFSRAVRAYRDAREAGFRNINLDLISALPGQTPESFARTLRAAAELAPEHISAYSLIIEENTPFSRAYGENSRDLAVYGEYRLMPEKLREKYRKLREKAPLLPGEDEEREMYRKTAEILAAYGYQRYEISNYAKPGYACRHNLGYWTGREYLGFGTAAASCLGGERMENLTDTGKYLALAPEDFLFGRQRGARYPESQKDRMEEFMFLGVRLMAGVSEADFLKRFGREMQEVYGAALRKTEREGLLRTVITPDGDARHVLTSRGLDLSNRVEEAFILEETGTAASAGGGRGMGR